MKRRAIIETVFRHDRIYFPVGSTWAGNFLAPEFAISFGNETVLLQILTLEESQFSDDEGISHDRNSGWFERETANYYSADVTGKFHFQYPVPFQSLESEPLWFFEIEHIENLQPASHTVKKHLLTRSLVFGIPIVLLGLGSMGMMVFGLFLILSALFHLAVGLLQLCPVW